MRWSRFEMKVENIARKSENRRSNKPLMEKRRRARINNCLNELKTLVLDAMKKDPSRHSKLEKADILEMTVKHLQNLHRQQVAFSVASDPAVMNKYCAGFSECASEVNRLISRMEGVDVTVKQRLVAHLSNYVNGSLLSATSASPHSIPAGVDGPPSGFQLIPTQLPNGDIALVLPSTNKSCSPGKQRGDPHQLFFYPISHPAIHSPLPGGQSHAGDMPLELTVHRLRRSSSVSPVESSDVDSRPGSLSPISSNFPVKMEMIYDDSVSRPRDVDLFDKDPWRPWY